MILDHVSNNLSTYLKENGNNRLLLGISGGVDSIVLLNILDKIKIKYSFNISLIHINYGMQRRSDNAEKLCYALASDYEIDIIVYSIFQATLLNRDEAILILRSY